MIYFEINRRYRDLKQCTFIQKKKKKTLTTTPNTVRTPFIGDLSSLIIPDNPLGQLKRSKTDE